MMGGLEGACRDRVCICVLCVSMKLHITIVQCVFGTSISGGASG